MSIKVNGTEIPTKKGNIKYNGTELTEVKFNGTSVWKVLSDPIYIIKEGIAQSIITNPTLIYPGHTCSAGNITVNSTPAWGVAGHTGTGAGLLWKASTGSINTNGASTLEITVSVASDGDATQKNIRTIIKDGSTQIFSKDEIYTEVINYSCLFWKTFNYTINISGHSSIEISVEADAYASSNAWIRIGINSAVLK